MGKKGGGAVPTAPDPVKTAQAQSQSNHQAAVDSASLNAVDIIGPGGKVIYTRRPDGTPRAQVTTLTPTGQHTFDLQQRAADALSGRALDAINAAPKTPFTLNGVPYDPRNVDTSKYNVFSANSYARPGGDTSAVGGGASPGAALGPGSGNSATVGNVWSMPQSGSSLPYDPRSYGDVGKIDQTAADRVFDEFKRTSGAQMDLETQRLTDDLNNRGIAVGSDAWNKAYSALQQSHDSAARGAANQAYLTGHQVAGDTIEREQGLRSTALQEALMSHNTANQDFANKLQLEQNLRGQIIGENNMVRNQGINDAAMYLQGAPAIQQPNTPNIPTYQIAPVDYAGIANANYANQMAAYNAQQQQKQGFWNGVGNLIGTGATLWKMCSRSYKHDLGDAESFLDRVQKLKMRTWQYTEAIAAANNLDTEPHIGPYAEDFADLFGGPSTRIHIGDALFILYRAVQELSDKVMELQSNVFTATDSVDSAADQQQRIGRAVS